jgi:hypothetical protein
MLKQIKTNYDSSYDKDINFKDFKSTCDYLESIIDFSIVNKDIKTFYLFLYLHDTIDILHSKDYKDLYDEWSYNINYNYAYSIEGFGIDDLTHYKDDLKDEIDTHLHSTLEKMFTI